MISIFCNFFKSKQDEENQYEMCKEGKKTNNNILNLITLRFDNLRAFIRFDDVACEASSYRSRQFYDDLKASRNFKIVFLTLQRLLVHILHIIQHKLAQGLTNYVPREIIYKVVCRKVFQISKEQISNLACHEVKKFARH